jgi:prepilin-type N-terminal cleavage/methylation domain-containing protein
MAKRAFTLIELLVVIAIIAILAAILFPVFAQAKVAAKKTSALSNIKQTGTATQMYLSDWDDRFPSAYSMYLDGGGNLRYWFNYGATYPAGWATDPSYIESEDMAAWGNAIQPYEKNYDLTEMPGFSDISFGFVAKPGRAAKRSGFSMNGFLNHWSGTAINLPSQVPLYWADDKVNWVGVVWANPYLYCNSTGPCMYNPDCPVQAGGVTGFCTDMWYSGQNMWGYAKNNVVVYTDTSAKSVRYGANAGGATAPNTPVNLKDPFRRYDANGYQSSPYYCGARLIECIFRPDKEE